MLSESGLILEDILIVTRTSSAETYTEVDESSDPRQYVRDLLVSHPKYRDAYAFLHSMDPGELEILRTNIRLPAHESIERRLGPEPDPFTTLIPYPYEKHEKTEEIVSLISKYESIVDRITGKEIALEGPSDSSLNVSTILKQLEDSIRVHKRRALEWQSTPKGSVGSDLGGLIIHDLGNYASVVTGYSWLYVQDSAKTPPPANTNRYLEKARAFIGIIKAFYEVIAMAESNQPFEIPSQKLLDTLLTRENISIDIPESFTIRSLEEFLAIRTHIFNAQQYGHSIRKPGAITVTRTENSVENTIEYSIYDDFSPTWRPGLSRRAWKAYEHGFNCPDLPLVTDKGGLIMSSFLAGQRAAKTGSPNTNIFKPSFDSNPGKKSKSVTLRFARQQSNP
jgi:hypothetical protein